MPPLEPNGPWTGELVDESLKYLRDPVWKAQKAGVMILSALAQTGMCHRHPESFP